MTDQPKPWTRAGRDHHRRVLAAARVWQEEERAAARGRLSTLANGGFGAIGPAADTSWMRHPRAGGETCGWCGEPWPCPPARVELAETMTPQRLKHVMSGYYAAAASPTSPARNAELYERFLGWVAA